jgi:hypothetical protein
MNSAMCRAPTVVIALALLLIAFTNEVPAVEHDPGVWTVFSTTDRFGTAEGDERWRYWFDAQARYFDIGTGINQWLVRPFVGYEFSNGIRVWQGYARFRTRNRAGNVADENRYIQQIDYTWRDWYGGTLSMRGRLLERFANIGDDMGLRVRFLTKYVRPTGARSSFVLSVEPFFDLRDTDWSGSSGLRQNRLFVGGNWRLGDHWSLEAGYMNQYLVVDGAENRSNHLGVFNFRYRRR